MLKENHQHLLTSQMLCRFFENLNVDRAQSKRLRWRQLNCKAAVNRAKGKRKKSEIKERKKKKKKPSCLCAWDERITKTKYARERFRCQKETNKNKNKKKGHTITNKSLGQNTHFTFFLSVEERTKNNF